MSETIQGKEHWVSPDFETKRGIVYAYTDAIRTAPKPRSEMTEGLVDEIIDLGNKASNLIFKETNNPDEVCQWTNEMASRKMKEMGDDEWAKQIRSYEEGLLVFVGASVESGGTRKRLIAEANTAVEKLFGKGIKKVVFS